MSYTRRELGRFAALALPAAVLSKHSVAPVAAQAAKPNSVWAGVRVGMNAPYNFGSNAMGGDEVLERCLMLGISVLELRSQPVEAFLGAPVAASGRGGGRQGGRGTPPTPEQQAATRANQQAFAASLRTWRTSASLDRVKDFRSKYETAGVFTEIMKFDGVFTMSDEEVDYAFQLAKAMGARALSCEIAPPDSTDMQRIGRFADKHRMMVGYHGHAETGPAHWEKAFGYAEHNGANLDIGHYVAGHSASPVPFLQKYHQRITHVHVKDRTFNNGRDLPFGQGDTPIAEVLRLIRDNKWNIQATIEFEYPVPAGSDRMAEIAKCIEYCRNILLT